MHKPELNGAQRQPGRAALVGLTGSEERLIVDLLTAQRVAAFGQVDANLMGSASLQATLDQGIVAQPLYGTNVSHRPFADIWQVGAAATSVAPIADQVALDRLRL